MKQASARRGPPTQKAVELDLSDTAEYLSVNANDLNLYFAGTYLKIGVPEQKDFVWANIAVFHQDEPSNTPKRDHVFVDVIFEKTTKIARYRLSDVDFDFSFPSVGLYNYKNAAIFFLRRNWRQNRKGLCEDTAQCLPVMSFFSPFVTIPLSFSLKNLWRWSVTNLNQTFIKSEYMELEDAFNRIQKCKCLAKALSLNFLLGQGITGETPSLWFRKTMIGTVLDKQTVEINNALFLQEALDFFQPQGINVQHKNP